ncbi:MAG TPA: Uma2 family endonuclease, partial [Vicinamibacteria bacterium]|nr:Uma2 family endonuclease [Vicinamibacteria bacterium]
TTEEFRNMIDAGVFQEDDRLELVDGEIVEMSPIGHRHAACVRKLNFLLRSVGARALVDVQNPLGISKDNDFYPDVVLLRPRADNYAGGIPDAHDTLLVIEVADTTLRLERSVKKSRYAAAGATELWIVDLEGSRVWIHRNPLEGEYGEILEARPGDVLKVPGMPDVEIPVADLIS